MNKHISTALFTLGLTALATGVTLAGDSPSKYDGHENHRSKNGYAPLVDKVQRATRRYKNINVALGEGWVRGTPCVSGPSSGAVGGALEGSKPAHQWYLLGGTPVH